MVTGELQARSFAELATSERHSFNLMRASNRRRHRIAMKQITPAPGKESVWDYPRPPKLELSSKHVRVLFQGAVVAESRRAFRVLETSHPPGWYIPAGDVRSEYLVRTAKTSFCEWKGQAAYWSVRVGRALAENAGWSYEAPSAPFAAIRGYVAFYPNVLECYVDDERVKPQGGGFYGGWVTSDVRGPFKGGPGTLGW